MIVPLFSLCYRRTLSRLALESSCLGCANKKSNFLRSMSSTMENSEQPPASLKRSPPTSPAPPTGETKRPKLDASPSGEKDGAEGSATTQRKQNRGSKRKARRKDDRSPSKKAIGGRRGTRPESVEGSEAGSDEEGKPKALRLPKRRCALLMGFSGTGYSGMQIQPVAKTIEGELFKALVAAGAISQDNADDPVKSNLQRAARTDAGVHAAGNLVSIKMITEVPGVPSMLDRINELLPPEIRLWNFIRVQNSFNARISCDSRKYTYFFPSYMLIPPKPGSGLFKNLMASSSPETITRHSFWDENAGGSAEDDLKRKRAWRCTPEHITALRTAARRYEKSHNFHNFTVGLEFNDRTTTRFMKSIEIAEPAVYGDTEWIAVLFHGQSFMLHQRKMMCALVMSVRTGSPPEVIDEFFGPRSVLIPKMPALGLLLEYPIFDMYNKKIAAANEKLSGPEDADWRPLIDFEVHRAQIDEFKENVIYTNMRAIEEREGMFDAWARHFDEYEGNDLLYLNPKGTVPTEAVIKRGERRENPFKEMRRFDRTSFANVGEGDAQVIETQEESEEEESGETRMDKKKLADMEG